MKKNHYLSAILFCACFLHCSISQAQFATLPLQTSFESGLPAGWNTGTFYPGNAWAVNTLAGNAYAGTRSMLSYNPFSSGSGNTPHGIMNPPAIWLDSGYAYQVRFYQKCMSGAVNNKLMVTVNGIPGHPVTAYVDSTLTNTSYQLRTGTFQVPEDNQYVINFDNFSPYYTTTSGIFIDSVSIFKVPLPLCTGAVATGTLKAADTTLCPGDTAILKLSGYPTGNDGVNRTWQVSNDSGLTWQPIAGATGIGYGYTFSATAAFRVVATCTFTGASTFSNIVYLHRKPVIECYCKPVYQITNATVPPFKMMCAISLNGEQGTRIYGDLNTCYTCTSGALNYYDRTDILAPVVLYTDTVYTIRHEMNNSNWAAYMFKIWIDLDNNAVFDANEALYYDNAYQYNQNYAMSIIVPRNTAPGMHRMRILMVNSQSPAPVMSLAGPCDVYASGETRDYLVNIQSPLVPANDQPAGATMLTLGAGCSGLPNGTTISATMDPGEPLIACSAVPAPYNSVWYKFVAPASGKVRISTANTNGTLPDTKMMVYSVGSPAAYNTFTPLACDDDNGSSVRYSRSLLYVTKLQAGQVYYVQVAKKEAGMFNGTFCISADELVDSMISLQGSCLYAGTNALFGGNTWVSLVDAQGKLVSNVRSNTARLTTLESPAYIHNGATRASGTKRFLNRNWGLYMVTAPLTAAADIQLFIRKAEWSALAAAAPGITPATALITQLSGSSCSGSYAPAGFAVNTLALSAQDTLGVIFMETKTRYAGNIFISGVNTTGVGTMNTWPGKVVLYPNPVPGEQLQVSLELPEGMPLKTEVIDMTGRQIATQQWQCRAGSQSFFLPVQMLAPGMYQLRLSAAGKGVVYNTRFVRQ